MTLERALETAIAELLHGPDARVTRDEGEEAATVLREHLDKGLKFYRAAEDRIHSAALELVGIQVEHSKTGAPITNDSIGKVSNDLMMLRSDLLEATK